MEEQFEAAEFPQQSPLVWLFRALGMRYTIFLPFITLLALVLAMIAVMRFKTPALTALLLAVVPLPLFYGAMATIDGLLASWQVIGMSSVNPKPSELADGGAMSLVSMQVGLILTLPVYVLAIVALIQRSFSHSEADQPQGSTEPPIGATLARKV